MTGGASVDRLLADLARWTADERAGEAVRGRQRERWLRQQQLEDARLTGVAIDLAERAVPVVIGTTAGRTVRGRIAAVATDFWVVDGPTHPTLVVSEAVSTVRPAPGVAVGDATGDRETVLDMRFGDALAALAGDRPRVQFTVGTGAEAVTGELRAMGADVVTVRVDGSPPGVLYVALSSISECSILGSG